MKEYANYEEYLIHQGSKLNKFPEEVMFMNDKIRDIVYRRYKNKKKFHGKTVMCLGARLGGEVEAFKKLGAVAIGIDVEPGGKNQHVVYGDFHNTGYVNEVFDYVYCNCIDHAYDLDKFFSEAQRILKKSGTMFLEVAIQKAGEYETIDTETLLFISSVLNKYFQTMGIESINNVWDGKLFYLKRHE